MLLRFRDNCFRDWKLLNRFQNYWF